MNLLDEVGPARAGMILAMIMAIAARTCWPRTSGDDPGAPAGQAMGRELAPHERG